jgi:predicted AAA+ superfamily ATPase
LLQENISQSLAGRIGYLYLLPFSTEEIATITNEQQSIEDAIYNGGYPPIYDNHILPNRWLSNYIRTYVERDVRQIKNINNLGAFERFVKLCAGRIGQLLNVTSLANETGVDAKTITSWISVLESSFIVYLLKPHHQNFNKRLVKMPKLYFYDTGLACSLLGIQNAEQLKIHSAMGNLFENHVITDMIKTRYNSNEPMNLYFWRDNVGNEMDVVIDNAGTLYPVEIKSSKTITPEFFKNFKFWQKISGTEGGAIIYGGEQIQNRSNGLKIVPWNSLEARV